MSATAVCRMQAAWLPRLFRLLLAGWLMALAGAVAPALAAEGGAGPRAGMVVTPKNFPNHDGDDVADMFRRSAELGSFAVMRVNWSDDKRWEAAQAMLQLAERQNLGTVLEFTALKTDELKGARLDPPKDVADAAGRRLSLSVPAVAERFSKAVLELAELRPDHLAVATDVNLLQQSDPAEFDALVAVYRQLYPRIKQRSPNTRLYVSFQWDALQAREPAARRLVDAFGDQLDVLTLNSDPRRLFEKSGPSALTPAYFGRAADLARRGAPVFLQVTWPSEGSNGESEQAAFIRDLPRLTGTLKPSMLAWTFLHDVRILKIFVGRLGLLTADGKPKPALAAWRALAAGGTPMAGATAAPSAAALPRLARSAATTASREPAQFAVFTARRDGGDLKILISDPEREMSHPRVSPDRSRVVITRYTRRGKDGKATEEQGYEGTEILVMNLDGSALEVVVPARQGIVAANGCWTPDGKALMFISTDTPQRTPELRQIDLATRQVTHLPTPPGLKATDPHWEAGKIVFPAKADEGKGADALWLMDADGGNARQITRPARSKNAPGLYGDFDPKISPDGGKVAFMRIDGGESWRVMVLDLASGEEKLLTPPGVIQWLPTWSSDGKLLLYVHVDRKNPKDIGLYTMTPDGRDRRMIPLPRGYLYGHSTFFPGDGSSESARIIFNGTPKAGL